VQALESGAIPRRDRAGLGLAWLERGIELAARSWRSSGHSSSAEPSVYGDAAESAILVALCAGLWLVLWRRRAVRAAAAAAGGGAPQWLGAQQVRMRMHLPSSLASLGCRQQHKKAG
jgi:hypothetical protein